MEVASLDMRDLWYARALLPVFEHENCKEIMRINGKKAAWRINGERLIIAKKGTPSRQRKYYWQCTFKPDELAFCTEEGRHAKICLLLVCGETVCALSWKEAQKVMRPAAEGRQEPLYVRTKNKQWYEIKGANASVHPLLVEKTSRRNLLKYVYYP
jgi:hypothetical protein